MEQFSSSGFGTAAVEAALLPLIAACTATPVDSRLRGNDTQEYDDCDWWSSAAPVTEDCRYHNAGTCPDCGTGMVRLGNCYSCPGCGWGSCG